MGSEIWTPEVFLQTPVHLEILVQEMFFGTLTMCQILWAKMNHTVQVLRTFVVYHVIWKYKGRSRCVFGGSGITVRPGLPIELSLINLYILCWRHGCHHALSLGLSLKLLSWVTILIDCKWTREVLCWERGHVIEWLNPWILDLDCQFSKAIYVKHLEECLAYSKKYVC